MSTSTSAKSAVGADPGSRPGGPGDSGPRLMSGDRDRVASIQPGVSIPALTMSVLVLVLGVLLGVSNQVSDGTGMALRVPALIAALLMVGQGILGIKRSMTASPKASRPAGAAYNGGRPSPVASLPKPKASSYSVPVMVLALAVWLGLANLQIDAPTDLATYSLISSFALFAIALSQLPTRG